MDEPDPPHLLAPAVSIVPMILKFNSGKSKAQLAKLIYTNCAGLYDDDALEPSATSDFAVNPDYEADIEALYSEAVKQPPDAATLLGIVQRLSSKFKAAREVPLADKSTPMKRRHEPSSDEDGDEGMPLNSTPGSSTLPFDPQDRGRARSKSSTLRPSVTSDGVVIERTYVTYLDSDYLLGSPALHFIRKDIARGLSRLVAQRDDYWQRWSPRTSQVVGPETVQHIESLRLWTVPHSSGSVPDLMTYMLGELAVLDPEVTKRLEKLFENSDICWQITNSSGTGKTRLIFESLSLEYGFYFTGSWHPLQDPYGSRDLQAAIDSLRERNIHEGPEYFDPLDNLETPNDARAFDVRSTNDEIAQHIFSIVILARAIVLDSFLSKWVKRAKELGLTPEQTKRTGARLWCRLQISPKLGDQDDVFYTLTIAMLKADPKSVLRHIDRLSERWAPYSNSGVFDLRLIVVDEAQSPSTRFPNAFCSEDGSTARPVLRPLVTTILKAFPSPQLLVAGTKLSEDIVREAIGSAVGKKDTGLRSFADLGGGTDTERIAAMLKHFLGEVYVQRIPTHILSDTYFWLPGRYRFTTLFIQHVLAGGLSSFEDMTVVLYNMIWRLSGVRLVKDFPELVEINPSRVISRRLRKIPLPDDLWPLVRELMTIVHHLVTGKGFPIVKDGFEDYITMGIGRLGASLDLNTITSKIVDDRSPIVIDEPIILAALVEWLNSRPEHNFDAYLHAILRTDLGDPKDPKKGYGWEDVVLFKLKQTLSAANGVLLTDVIEFKYLPPEWAGSTVQLVSVLSAFSTTGMHVIASSTIDGPIVFESTLPHTTLRWFQGQDGHRVAFLKPDIYLGPDVVLGLRLSTGQEVLLVLQMKHWQHDQNYPYAVRTALYKLSPEYYWKVYAERQALLQRMDSLPAHGPKMPERSSTVAKQQTVSGNSYDGGPAKYPIVRVLCTIDGSHKHPDYDSENLGAYPIAYLSPKFLQDCTVDVPAIKQSIAIGKTMTPYQKDRTV